MNSKINILLIRTPEGIVFSQALAGPVTRFLAWGIDLAGIGALTGIAGTFIKLLGLIVPDLATALTIFAYFLISIGYGILLEWHWRGQTIGKRVLRLRVVDAQGLRLRFTQIVLRNLLRFVDMLPAFYLTGGVACLASPRGQRLGDIAANTVVVRNPRMSEPDLEQLVGGKFNSLREYPHLAARLRQRVSPGEASLALQALMRRDEFDPPARVLLFRELVAHFQAIVDFPPEATEGIADEQYVRNLADILFRSGDRGKMKGLNPMRTDL